MTFVEYDKEKLQEFEIQTTAISNGSLVGSCELGTATIQLLNDSNEYSEFKNKWIKTNQGSFYIYDVEPVQEKINIKLSCYNIIYLLDVPYEQSKFEGMFPCKIKEWRAEIAKVYGIVFNDNDKYPFADLVLSRHPYVGENPTVRNVFQVLLQACLSFMEVDENDNFYFAWIKDEEPIYISDWLELTTEKVATEPVNEAALGRGDVEDIVIWPNPAPDNPKEFRIDNNYILDPQDTEAEKDRRHDVIKEVYDRVNGFSYVIYDMRTQSVENPFDIKLGSKIKYIDIWGNEIESIVMSKTLKWLGDDLDNQLNYEIKISAEQVNESSSELSYAGKLTDKVHKLSVSVDRSNHLIQLLNQKTDETSEEVAKLEIENDEIRQLISGVAITFAEGENDFGRIAFENLANCKPLYIKIHPTDRDISVLYPDEEIYPSDDLFLDERVPNLVFKNTKTKEKFEFEFPELFQYKGAYDELFIDFVNDKYELIQKIGADENEFIDVQVGDNLNGKILKLNFPEDIDLTTDRILLTGPTKYYYGDEANLEIKVSNGRIIINCWLVSPFYQMSVDVDITEYKTFTLLKNDNSYTFDNVISVSEEALNGHYFQLENPNYGQKVVLANPIVKELELPNIVLSEGDYEVFLDNDDIGYLYAKMLLKSDFSDMYATKYELKTSITQTENIIKESVSATIEDVNKDIKDIQGSMELKLDIDKLISQFNLAVNQVIINSDNFKLDAQGNITMASGAKIIGGYGLLTNITINATILSREFVGSGLMLPLHTDEELIFQFTMPKAFHVEKAYVILNHAPCKITRLLDGTMEEVTYTGYCRNLKLYKYTNVNNLSFEYEENNWNPPRFAGGTLTEIPNAFGNSGFTGSSSSLSRKNSIDIKEHISTSESSEVFNVLKIKSSNTVPEVDTPSYYQQAGVCGATLVIVGYMAVFE